MKQQHKAPHSHISVRIDADTLRALEEICEAIKVERSALIRAILAQFVRMVSDSEGRPRGEVVIEVFLHSLAPRTRGNAQRCSAQSAKPTAFSADASHPFIRHCVPIERVQRTL